MKKEEEENPQQTHKKKENLKNFKKDIKVIEKYIIYINLHGMKLFNLASNYMQINQSQQDN